MKILTVLTYYRPHTSGLTIYAERLARAFARRGHQVTVMTTQFDPSLLLEETLGGVRIVRVPVAARVSKGVTRSASRGRHNASPSSRRPARSVAASGASDRATAAAGKGWRNGRGRGQR